MTDLDKEKLAIELCTRWPKAGILESDVAYWIKQLGDYPLDRVLEALTAWKNTSKYAPKVYEIKAKLSGLPSKPGEQANRKDQTHADIIRERWLQAGFNVAKMTDAEIYLRYHAKTQACLAMTAKADGYCQISDGAARKIVRECTRDLTVAGVEPVMAESFAQALMDPENYRIPERSRSAVIDRSYLQLLVDQLAGYVQQPQATESNSTTGAATYQSSEPVVQDEPAEQMF